MTTLSVEAFGQALIQTGDLDPVYLMLEGAQLDRATLQRWCLAYWMFYHAGVASRLAEREGADFWKDVVTHLSGPDQFPRGTERRHFRGKAAVNAVNYLSDRYSPERAVASLVEGLPTTLRAGVPRAGEASATILDDPVELQYLKPASYTEVARRVRTWIGFGPWIAFKVADMLDAILGVPVDFMHGFPDNIFDAPWQGALWFVANDHDGIERTPETLGAFEAELSRGTQRALVGAAFADLLGRFKRANLCVPHRPGLPLRVQEIETVLCKWKSHVNGHYPVGKDTQEILHALNGWGPVADKCHHALMQWPSRRE